MMNNDEKKRFDSLEVLRQSAWNSFHHRRAFEWKVCLALWTAFASFIGIVITGKSGQLGMLTAITTIIVCIAIIVIYLNWIKGLSRAHDIDKRIMVKFRNEMMDILGSKFSEDLEKEQENVRRNWPRYTNWTHSLQIGFTCILAFAAVIAVWSKTN
ncbi:MAG: hypothetical protein GY797_22375 [Deltaproteobacteria bacterium]|nr:hypothetical protein [Deltaproteobacteria bacterium]